MDKISLTRQEPDFNWYDGLCFGKQFTKTSKGAQKVEQKLWRGFYRETCSGAQMFGQRNTASVAEVVFCYNPVVMCWSAGVGDVILCWHKDGVLCLLEQFVIFSSVPNESDTRGGTGNPYIVFCVLLLCPEIAAWFEDSGRSSEGKNEKKSKGLVKTSVRIWHLRLVKPLCSE